MNNLNNLKNLDSSQRVIRSLVYVQHSYIAGDRLTYLNINEKANDQTSQVLENPPPYPLLVQPPSMPPTARAILEATADLNVIITAIKQIIAPPNVKEGGGTLLTNPVTNPVVDCRRFEAEMLSITGAKNEFMAEDQDRKGAYNDLIGIEIDLIASDIVI